MSIPEKIANLLNEWPEDVKRLDTPSQVFSQALLHSDDMKGLSLEDAIQEIFNYSRVAGVDPLLAREAADYARQVWGHYGHSNDPADMIDEPDLEDEDGFDDAFEDRDIDPLDPDAYSSRGF